MKQVKTMKVINEPANHKITEDVEYSNASMVKKAIEEENDMSFVAKCKALEEEAYFCFVLGYN
ncbi:MAG: hypothetical protein ACI9LM_004191 [Alteromonadaceae bacterium]|jgi:hypothetical protein